MAGKNSQPEVEPKTSWPQPGDEGFVHPDGTEQAQRQLADNLRAAAERRAARTVADGRPTGASALTDQVAR